MADCGIMVLAPRRAIFLWYGRRRATQGEGYFA
jgi:hypothetical protein